jgi:hypothetical protein
VEGKTIKKLIMKISELPEEVREFALNYQLKERDSYYSKITANLGDAFDWAETKEGASYWGGWNEKQSVKEEPKHYNNSKGSLYQFCDNQELNSYEFDIIKRIMRCRKKGNFLEDLEKTKFAIDLYIKEQLENNK